MTKPLLAILLLLPLSVSAGELDGKAIQCFSHGREGVGWGSEGHQSNDWYFRFDNSNVILDNMQVREGVMRINPMVLSPYFTTLTLVSFGGGLWTLDRQSLVLTNSGGGVGGGVAEGFSVNCEVFQNHTEYFDALEKLRVKLQAEVHAIAKSNKI